MKANPEVDIFVRFCETDAAGHVNNASYFLYLEEARTKFFDLIGTDEYNENLNFRFLVASVTCDFLKQAYAKQILTVITRVSKIGTKSFHLEHEIKLAETGELVAKGSSVLVGFNVEEQQSKPIPAKLRSILEEFMSFAKTY
jgi:acyl-CoA thioester hydrolase